MTVRAFGTRRGKAAVTRTIIPALRSDIVVFADARQRFERHTLRALVDNFSDPTIGAVGGELMLSTGNGPSAAGRGAAFYWRYEKFIRSTEASADSRSAPAARSTPFDVRYFNRLLMTPSWMMCSSRCASFVRDTEWYSSRERWRTTVRRQRRAGVRAEGAYVAGALSALCPRAVAAEPAAQPALVRDDLAQGAASDVTRVPRRALHIGVRARDRMAGCGWALIGQTAFYLAAFGGYSHRQRRSFVFTVPCAMCVLIWATVVGFIRSPCNVSRSRGNVRLD